MNDGFWDQFANGEYVKLENVGDEVIGVILEREMHTFEDREVDGKIKPGQTVPRLLLRLRDGTEKQWTVGHVDAIKQLVGLRPQVGQIVRAKIVRDLGPGKGKGKLYEVEVRNQATPTTPDASSPPAAVGDDDQPTF